MLKPNTVRNHPPACGPNSLEAFVLGHLVHIDIVNQEDTTLWEAAQHRMETIHYNINSVGGQNLAALVRKLPRQLQLRSEIHSLPPKDFMGFWMSPQVGDGSVTVKRESGTLPSSEPPVVRQSLANNEPTTVKRESSALSVPETLIESRSLAKERTKALKREGSSPLAAETPERKRTSIAANVPKTPQSDLLDRGQRARAHVESAEHQDILAQFRKPSNNKGSRAGRIEEEWGEVELLATKRLLGWQ